MRPRDLNQLDEAGRWGEMYGKVDEGEVNGRGEGRAGKAREGEGGGRGRREYARVKRRGVGDGEGGEGGEEGDEIG